MVALGLCCFARAFSSCGERGLLFVLVHGLLIVVASVVVGHGLSCPVACGIFSDQGLNPCPLHWQAGSLPLSHLESPIALFLKPGAYILYIMIDGW